MSEVSESVLREALATVQDPDRGRDLIAAGAIRELRVEGGRVRFYLALLKTGTPEAAATRSAAERVVMALPGVAAVEAKLVNAAPEPAHSGGTPGKRPIPGARHVIAVSSGKGGVGKSTVCVNLACAAARAGHAVGILDGDIYGPNIPLMMGARGRPEGTNEKIFPFVAHGLQLMSMGLLVGDDQPMVWRGPMLNKAVTQFMFQVDWKDLDYLFVDLPPGTGDVQLTLTQNTELSGAVIVTTPQEVAVLDVRKAIRMFEKIGTPVLGVVENMSWFQPPGHEERYELFGSGGGARIEREFGVPLLGQIPIGMAVRSGGDEGRPITIASPDDPIAKAFQAAASRLLERIDPRVTNMTSSDSQTPARGADPLTGESTMSQALAGDPNLPIVLMRFHIGGCSLCGFEPEQTVAEVAEDNGVPLEVLLEALNDSRGCTTPRP